MLNNCLILGWVKFEPDAKVMKNGKEVCTLEIQCARQYRDKDNKRVYDYISCRCFVPGLIKYISNFVTKGSQVIVGAASRLIYTWIGTAKILKQATC